MTEDIDEFGEYLANLQTDSTLNWAGVKGATPVRREQYFPEVDPSDEDAGDYGLSITFETASGREFSKWFRKPPEWDAVMSDLVLLLQYWQIAPGDIDKLNGDDEVYEVPIQMGADGRPEIDFQAVERENHSRALEEADDAPE